MIQKNKKIVWESWNEKEQEMLVNRQAQNRNMLSELRPTRLDSDIEYEEEGEDFVVNISNPPILTPFGLHNSNSIFRPSERWECWIAHTNFPITNRVFKILNEQILGIEALSILGSYTFCIGIARLFSAHDVKMEVQKILCGEENGASLGE